MKWIKFLFSIIRPINLVIDKDAMLVFQIPRDTSVADAKWLREALTYHFPAQKILIIHGLNLIGAIKNEED